MSHETTDTKASTESPFGPRQSRWRIWVVRVVVFTLAFVMLMVTFSFLGTIVEKFFIALYTD
jgi:hypothetical protein